MVDTATVPVGTSITLLAATSADNITYSSYSAIGSASISKWAKIQIQLNTDAGNTVTPIVSSVH